MPTTRTSERREVEHDDAAGEARKDREREDAAIPPSGARTSERMPLGAKLPRPRRLGLLLCDRQLVLGDRHAAAPTAP